MASARAEWFAELWDEAGTATLKAVEELAEGKRFSVAQEGKAHPLWLVGHIATVNNLLVGVWCCENENGIAKEFRSQFMPEALGGDPIVTDPAKYPSWDAVVQQYKKVAEACSAGIRELSDAELNGALRGGAPDDMNERFGPVGKMIRGMVGHESHHRGQLLLLGALD